MTVTYGTNGQRQHETIGSSKWSPVSGASIPAVDPLEVEPKQGHGGAPSYTCVSAVIPTWNEARNIGWVLQHLPECVDEVIIVDGGSVDNTVAAARSARPDAVFVTQTHPGKGAALVAGFAAATCDVIVTLDADGSMHPAEITRYLKLIDEGFDFVKGSRFMAGGGSDDITHVRRVGNRCLVSLFNRLYGAHFTDLCYGYFAFRRTELGPLALDACGFEIETQVAIHAVRAQLRITEVPSFEHRRRFGRSNLHAVRDGMRVLRVAVDERLSGSAGNATDVLLNVVPPPSAARLEPEVAR